MNIDFSQLSGSEIYHIMTQTIVPRPIAWVLTDSGEQNYNLAPFSYFNAICSTPPLIMFSVGKKPDGSDKDTLHNIQRNKQFVVHIPGAEMAATVTETAKSLPHGESELNLSQLATEPFTDFPLPRISQCKLAMACSLFQIQAIGDVPQQLVFGKVEQLYINDAVAKEDNKGRLKVDAMELDPLARLGANEYASLGDSYSHTRPK
ncbi:flavin reductase family protein [Corallincola luteus]|uniref:Flavin reductase family protein n=2 Tax=Corallincola TaxID=1775176 RepID=A0A368N5T3_9GAMM|nr:MULTISPECIES: flavin reductase family protein [Corallincola]RCU44619.1 flavin reductase family protein [Corallincola holothuriorum]TCI05324.1 flavin reductase family protein [Corallincola luteus]